MSNSYEGDWAEATNRTLAFLAAMDEPDVQEAQHAAQWALHRFGAKLLQHDVPAAQVLMQLTTIGTGVWYDTVVGRLLEDV